MVYYFTLLAILNIALLIYEGVVYGTIFSTASKITIVMLIVNVIMIFVTGLAT